MSDLLSTTKTEDFERLLEQKDIDSWLQEETSLSEDYLYEYNKIEIDSSNIDSSVPTNLDYSYIEEDPEIHRSPTASGEYFRCILVYEERKNPTFIKSDKFIGEFMENLKIDLICDENLVKGREVVLTFIDSINKDFELVLTEDNKFSEQLTLGNIIEAHKKYQALHKLDTSDLLIMVSLQTRFISRFQQFFNDPEDDKMLESILDGEENIENSNNNNKSEDDVLLNEEKNPEDSNDNQLDNDDVINDEENTEVLVKKEDDKMLESILDGEEDIENSNNNNNKSEDDVLLNEEKTPEDSNDNQLDNDDLINDEENTEILVKKEDDKMLESILDGEENIENSNNNNNSKSEDDVLLNEEKNTEDSNDNQLYSDDLINDEENTEVLVKKEEELTYQDFDDLSEHDKITSISNDIIEFTDYDNNALDELLLDAGRNDNDHTIVEDNNYQKSQETVFDVDDYAINNEFWMDEEDLYNEGGETDLGRGRRGGEIELITNEIELDDSFLAIDNNDPRIDNNGLRIDGFNISRKRERSPGPDNEGIFKKRINV